MVHRLHVGSRTVANDHDYPTEVTETAAQISHFHPTLQCYHVATLQRCNVENSVEFSTLQQFHTSALLRFHIPRCNVEAFP
jgi:hypothetical protein